MFPIPVTDAANRSFRDTVEKFQTESLLEGEMKVSVQNISNRLNLNLLRMDMTKYNPDTAHIEANSMLDQSDQAINSNVNVGQALFFTLKRLVEEKKDVDEGFEDRHGNLNYQEMVSKLYFMIHWKISIWLKRWSISMPGGSRPTTTRWGFAVRSVRPSSFRWWHGWSTS